jgi:hypothetical protein
LRAQQGWAPSIPGCCGCCDGSSKAWHSGRWRGGCCGNCSLKQWHRLLVLLLLLFLLQQLLLLLCLVPPTAAGQRAGTTCKR